MTKEEIYFRGRITSVEQNTYFDEKGHQTTTSKIHVRLFRGARMYEGRKIEQVGITYLGPVNLREGDEIRFNFFKGAETTNPNNLEGRTNLITRSNSRETFVRFTSTQ